MENNKSTFNKYSVLFVCLGNICRSPSAEAVMKKLVADENLTDKIYIDSAGIINYHEGENADSRMRAHAIRRGYNLDSISRPVRTEDFYKFDLIIGMDNRNVDDLKEKAPDLDSVKKIHRVCQLNCVTLDCQELLGDNSERLFLGKLGQGSMPCLSFSTLVA